MPARENINEALNNPRLLHVTRAIEGQLAVRRMFVTPRIEE